MHNVLTDRFFISRKVSQSVIRSRKSNYRQYSDQKTTHKKTQQTNKKTNKQDKETKQSKTNNYVQKTKQKTKD